MDNPEYDLRFYPGSAREVTGHGLGSGKTMKEFEFEVMGAILGGRFESFASDYFGEMQQNEKRQDGDYGSQQFQRDRQGLWLAVSNNMASLRSQETERVFGGRADYKEHGLAAVSGEIHEVNRSLTTVFKPFENAHAYLRTLER